MANISAIKLPSGNTYDLKDKNALETNYTEVIYGDERDSGSIWWTTTPDGATLQGRTSGGYWSITPSGLWLGYGSQPLLQFKINADGFRFDNGDYGITLPKNVRGVLPVGTGTSGYLTKWDGTNSLANGPQLGSSTTTFLRNDGSWATPVGTTYDVVSKTANGLTPQLPNETTTTKFLRQDGSWAVPSYTVNTDTKVNMIQRGTTKAYLLGTTTAPTSTNQAVTSVAETGVYFDTTAATLVATTFKGALTGTASGNLTSSSTLNAAKLSGAIPSAVTATTQASTDNSTKIATTAYVTTAIANLPEPMLFKGSVGTGGTVTSLPTAAASNEGWTYKVITALSSPSAKVGDTVISNGSEWVVIPSGDEPSGTVTSVGITNGGGLSVSGSPITSSGSITVSHADTSSQASSSNSGRTYIQSITLDTYGHVTALSTATETVTNTDTKVSTAAVTSGTTYYPVVGADTTSAATKFYDKTGLVYKGTNGTTSTVGGAELTLGNSTASGTANNKQAQLVMYGSNAKKATITLAAPSADIALALPTSAGTLALTSQIPTVPNSTGSSTTGITASTTATKTTLGTAFTIPNVTSAGSASSWTFEEKTIPNVTAAGSASTWAFEDIACDDITNWSAGSGSSSLTMAMDTTDTKKLKITFSHTHTAPSLSYTARTVSSKKSGSNGTAPTLGTAIKVQSKSGGGNGTAPTLGTAFTVPNVTGNTSATVSITDNGHTHTI